MRIIQAGTIFAYPEGVQIPSALPRCAADFCKNADSRDVLDTLAELCAPAPARCEIIAELGWRWEVNKTKHNTEPDPELELELVCSQELLRLWLVPAMMPCKFDPHCITALSWKELYSGGELRQDLSKFLLFTIEMTVKHAISDLSDKMGRQRQEALRTSTAWYALRELVESIPHARVFGCQEPA